jgi:hypothetical protein
MPASLYRLAGKPHHTEPPVVVETIVAPSEPEVQQVVEEVIQPPEVTVEEVFESTPEIVEPPKIVWDSTWTRTKLYQVAIDAGLSVDATMTKANIINVLSKSNMS